jgi:hypothetical protein
MMTLIGLLFRKPNHLLDLLKYLMGKSFSNEDKRTYLVDAAAKHSLPAGQRFKMDNPLFHDDFLVHLQTNPEAAERAA